MRATHCSFFATHIFGVLQSFRRIFYAVFCTYYLRIISHLFTTMKSEKNCPRADISVSFLLFGSRSIWAVEQNMLMYHTTDIDELHKSREAPRRLCMRSPEPIREVRVTVEKLPYEQVQICSFDAFIFDL